MIIKNITNQYLIESEENQYFDRKSARIKPVDILRHIVAFANANGGVLVVGIEDNGEITGFDCMNAHKVNEFLEAPYLIDGNVKINYEETRRSSSASSITSMPSVCALVSLLPAASPATTKAVFLLTEDAGLPPLRAIRSSASFRESVGSVPVTTMLMPANTPPSTFCFSAGVTPAASKRRIISRFSSNEKNSVMLWATMSPTSSRATSSACVALDTFSSVPNAFAKSRAVLRPIFGMPTAKRNASSSQCLLFSSADSRLSAFLSLKPSSDSTCSRVRVYKSAGSRTFIWS